MILWKIILKAITWKRDKERLTYHPTQRINHNMMEKNIPGKYNKTKLTIIKMSIKREMLEFDSLQHFVCVHFCMCVCVNGSNYVHLSVQASECLSAKKQEYINPTRQAQQTQGNTDGREDIFPRTRQKHGNFRMKKNEKRKKMDIFFFYFLRKRKNRGGIWEIK